MISFIRTILLYSTAAAATVVLGLAVIIAALLGVKDKPNGIYDKVPRWWSRAVLFAVGIKVRVHGMENASGEGPYIFASNHVSWFDVPSLAKILPRNKFVAKSELFKVPIFGRAMRAAGMIEIQRENRKAAFGAYDVAAERIRGGNSVVVFPEGTRGHAYPLRPFKKGPFAFAIAALLTRRLDAEWLAAVRRWALLAWFFNTVGIVLGMWWAYVELGWGGYWAWDPVENASLMPWLTGTAFLHSIMVQEKRGMLRKWNVTLVVSAFLLSIFGTFITRSGVISSVHSFAQSPVGKWFAAFLILAIVVTAYLVSTRLQDLKSTAELESMISREAAFLYNNLVLVGIAFSVLWGTLFPIISEAVRGNKITVGPPFFNTVNIPLGLLLLLLTGIGPLIAWRRASVANRWAYAFFPTRVAWTRPEPAGIVCSPAPPDTIAPTRFPRRVSSRASVVTKSIRTVRFSRPDPTVPKPTEGLRSSRNHAVISRSSWYSRT